MKRTTLRAIGIGIAALLLSLTFIAYIAGGAPTLSQSMVAAKIGMSTATADGKTVDEILREMGVANTIWTIQDGDWRGFEGKAFASCFLKDGTAEIFAWQWDAAWPHALAITPKTAMAFPLMDPGVDLQSYGQSSLWEGRGAIDKYFRKK